MKTENLFSIVVPTYNAGSTIERALQSVLEQSFRFFEVLVVDNQSTDGTLDIVRRLNDARIRVLSEKDCGIYDAMNKGIDLCRASWIYFLGSDDYLQDNLVLERIAGCIATGDFDVIYGQVIIEKTGEIYAGEFDARKLVFRNISHQAIFFKSNLFETIGRFELKYKICADHILNVKWFFNNALRKKYIDIIVATFGSNGVSSKEDDIVKVAELPGVVRRYAGLGTYLKFYVFEPKLKRFRKKWTRLFSRFARTTI
jgi:glycosyltransferase involved in cell wall biosynthesis